MIPINGQQIKRIHTIKKELGLDDDNYRALLSGYGVSSSKDLSQSQADILILNMSAMQGKASIGNRWAHLGHRPGMATPKQLGMLDALWSEVSVFKDQKRRDEARDVFLRNHFKRSCMEHVEMELVERIRKTLIAMRDKTPRSRRESKNMKGGRRVK